MVPAGSKSVARRLLRTAVAHLANVSAAQELGAAENLSEIEDVLVKHSLQPQLESLAGLVVQSAKNESEARCVYGLAFPPSLSPSIGQRKHCGLSRGSHELMALYW